MLLVPATQIYNDVRQHIAKGLNAGGIRILWHQFPLGKMAAMEYANFRYIFGSSVGWHKYRPHAPPQDPLLRLTRPEGRPGNKKPSLSFAQSQLKQVLF